MYRIIYVILYVMYLCCDLLRCGTCVRTMVDKQLLRRFTASTQWVVVWSPLTAHLNTVFLSGCIFSIKTTFHFSKVGVPNFLFFNSNFCYKKTHLQCTQWRAKPCKGTCGCGDIYFCGDSLRRLQYTDIMKHNDTLCNRENTLNAGISRKTHVGTLPTKPIKRVGRA